jgi:pimeloyl-ACP methyl ester carboxylesterase
MPREDPGMGARADSGRLPLLPPVLLLLFAVPLPAVVKGWPEEVEDARYLSAADNTQQPAMIYRVAGDEPRPLLVGLHTWSGGYRQSWGAICARGCIERKWHFIGPHFRGPNNSSQALGSELAVQDIISAVGHMKATCKVDPDRVYLVGVSGGGHMALLMAGRAPEIWAGVSAWCGISDVRAWFDLHKGRRYANMIKAAVGGEPDSDEKADAECRKRSPVTYLGKATRVNLDINHGVHDGRRGSVPFLHSLWAFNRVAAEADRITPEQMKAFYEERKVPAGLGSAPLDDPLYGKRKPLFRRVSGNARVTIFEGGHEIVHEAALNWLGAQRKGKGACWRVEPAAGFRTSDAEKQSVK